MTEPRIQKQKHKIRATGLATLPLTTSLKSSLLSSLNIIFGRRCTTRVWSFLGVYLECSSCAVAFYILGVGWNVWGGRRVIIFYVDW